MLEPHLVYLQPSDFNNLGVIKNGLPSDANELSSFLKQVADMIQNCKWNKEEIVRLFENILVDFEHIERGKYLDNKM